MVLQPMYKGFDENIATESDMDSGVESYIEDVRTMVSQPPVNEVQFNVHDLFFKDGQRLTAMGTSPMHTHIFGATNAGKTHACAWLIKEMNYFRRWDHLYLITPEASYPFCGQSHVAGDGGQKPMLFKENYEDNLSMMMKRLQATCKRYAQANERTLVIIHDMTDEIRRRLINLLDFVTAGRHKQTDVFVFSHGRFVCGREGAVLRDNFQYALCMGTSSVGQITKQEELIDRDMQKAAKSTMLGIMDDGKKVVAFLKLPIGRDLSKIKRFHAGQVTTFRIGSSDTYGQLDNINEDTNDQGADDTE